VDGVNITNIKDGGVGKSFHLEAFADSAVFDVGDVHAIHHVDVLGIARAIDLTARLAGTTLRARMSFPTGRNSFPIDYSRLTILYWR